MKIPTTAADRRRRHELLKDASRDMQREGLEVPGTILIGVISLTFGMTCLGASLVLEN